MAGSILSQAHFHDEEAAYAFVEARIWPKGAVCPHCGGTERNGKMGGKSTRIGAYKCYDCRKPFTVKIGTIFEASHIAMHLWLQAITLIAASKKGISSNQLHRTLGITLKSAWFMSHRIREAMRATGGDFFGGNGGFVEVDETFIGQDATKQTRASKTRGFGNKQKVLSIVDRTSGQARSQVVMDTKAATLLPLLQEKIAGQATLMTDEALQYYPIGKKFRKHERVNHSVGEYVSRLDAMIHTNTVEGFFSVFKRGMKGVYQHCGHQHLDRYLAEFDFRYNNRKALGVEDAERAERLLKGVVGKRLTYETVTQ